MVDAITQSALNKYVEIYKEDAGLNFLMKVEVHTDDQTFSRRLKEQGVKLIPLSAYYAKKTDHDKHIFIVNYSSVNQDKFDHAIEILTGCTKTF